MIFTQGQFLAFFAAAFAAYWLIGNNTARKVALLLASNVFYGAWDWRFLGLIWFTVIVDYCIGRAIQGASSERTRKCFLIGSVVSNLSILGYFKYFDFFVSSFVRFSDTIGLPMSPHTASIILPVGISFYTFQSLSYTIDVYRRSIPAQRSLLDFSLFVMFFPQLVAGPIVRASHFLPQLARVRRIGDVAFGASCALFLVGFFKKRAVADNVAPTVDAFFLAPEAYGTADAAGAITLYAIQIYCDFSGYSDMAIACAALLGYQFKPNFNHPYLARSIIEFWRCWHISLSTWLRDYLYVPLGGSRLGQTRTYVNLLATMLLGGLWHGAAWTFVIWGAAHGTALAANKAVRSALGKPLPPLVSMAVGLPLTFAWVCLAWVFFRAPTLDVALAAFASLTKLTPPTLMPWWGYVGIIAGCGIAHVFSRRFPPDSVAVRVPRPVFAALLGLATAVTLAAVRIDYRPFIYFQF